MSNLMQFLIDNPVDNLTAEVTVSPRLAKFPFKIKGMTGPDFSEYQKLSTKIGKRTVVLYNCNIDSTILTKLDTDSDTLDDDIDFTFDDFDILDSFGNPII